MSAQSSAQSPAHSSTPSAGNSAPSAGNSAPSAGNSAGLYGQTPATRQMPPVAPASNRVDSSAAAQQALQTQLHMEITASEQLMACLAEERQLMEAHDSEGLLRNVDRKTLALRQLETIMANRSPAFASLPAFFQNLPTQLIAQSPELSKTYALYNRLHQLARDVSHQNEVNAAINARGRQAVQRLLKLVRGNDEGASLYNQRGQSASRHYGQAISQA